MGLKLFTVPPTERYLILGAVILLFVVIRIGPMLFARNRPRRVVPLGTARNYALGGGTICPHCHRPFPLSLMGLKIGFGTKLVRCEFCGRWSLVRRRSIEELRAAEAAELAEAQPPTPAAPKTEAEKTRALLDETRYSDKP